MQTAVSRYLFTITLINLGVGLVDGIALWAIGVRMVMGDSRCNHRSAVARQFQNYLRES